MLPFSYWLTILATIISASVVSSQQLVQSQQPPRESWKIPARQLIGLDTLLGRTGSNGNGPSFAVRAAGPVAPTTSSPTPTPVHESNKTYTCPEGYLLFGKNCAQTITAEPTIHCTRGYTKDEDDPTKCKRVVSPTPQCISNFVLDNGLCTRTTNVTAELTCPPGYLMHPEDSRCVQSVQLETRMSCPNGSVQFGDQCSVEATEAPEFTCPADFTLNGANCLIKEEYDCTPQEPTTEGEQHTSMTGLNVVSSTELGKNTEPVPVVRALGSIEPRNLRGIRRSYSVEIPGSLVRASSAAAPTATTTACPPTTPCPATSAVVGPVAPVSNPPSTFPTVNAGLPTTAVPAVETPLSPPNVQQASAPKPFSLTLVTTIPPVSPFVSAALPQAGAHPARFRVELPSAPLSAVSTGYFQDSVLRSTCRRTRVVPAQRVCNDGVLDGDVCTKNTIVEKIPTPGRIQENSIAPIYVCPDDYTPDPDDETQCTSVENRAPMLMCLVGERDDTGGCVSYVKAAVKCDVGFGLEGDTCVQTILTPPFVEYTVTYSCVGKDCAGSTAVPSS